jgi:hypothetical protein
VHQLRPARETCEKCHWPDKFYGTRIKAFPGFAPDEASTPTFTTLALKVGSGTGEEAGTIHWHVAERNEVRYQAADDRRLTMEWVEVKRGDTFHRYTNRAAGPRAAEAAVHEAPRSMDCVDCHNRATHIYEDPEKAVDKALETGRISRELPFAKKVALGALLGSWADKTAANAGISNAVRGYYMREREVPVGLGREVDAMVSEVQAIYARNIFPGMNVGWNTYPSHIGHRGDAGCFRCHNRDMVDEQGAAIPYDCTLCHSILAQDSATTFQFLLPLEHGDPDLMLHKYLRDEFLGTDTPMPVPPDSLVTAAES